MGFLCLGSLITIRQQYAWVAGNLSKNHKNLRKRRATAPRFNQSLTPEERRAVENGMNAIANDAERVRRITAWPWVVSLNLKAN